MAHARHLSFRWFALLVLSSVRLFAAERVFPGSNWERDTNGLAPEIARSVDAYVHTIDTTALMVVRGGRVVYQFGDVTRLSYLASARKSVLSMLYGPYVASGKIRLEATLKDLHISDVGGLLPTEERAKVVDLVSARSGVYHPAANPGDLLFMAPKRGSKEPGTWWLYNNWDFNVAGAVFEQMTGENIYDALRDDLAIPLGMQDFVRQRQQKRGDSNRSRYPAYHMMLSTRDMARLGLLMLCEGQWRNRQLIPTEWVRRSTAVRTSPGELRPWEVRAAPWGYGYMWWVWDGPSAAGPFKGAYTAAGAFGQYITILPALDMVVAHKTWPTGKVTRNQYLRLLGILTGKQPASSAEVAFWNHAPKLCRVSRKVGHGIGILLDGFGIYPKTAIALAGAGLLFLFIFVRKSGFRKCLKVGSPAVGVVGALACIGVWVFTPSKAPAVPKARLVAKVDPRLYEAYTGRYSVVSGGKGPGTVTIRRNGDALLCQVPGQFEEEIFPESETDFFNTMEDALLTFLKNDKGEVTAMKISIGPKSYTGTKQ